MNTQKANSLTEFISIIESIKDNYYYRGERLSERPLICKLGRIKNVDGESFTLEQEINMLRRFQKRMGLHVKEKPTCDLEWLMIAQHYGLATRLVDFTTNPLVALYFSVEKEMPDKDKEKNSVVYYTSPPTPRKQESIKNPFNIGNDVAISPFFTINRMFNQQSRFILQHNPIEELQGLSLGKIEIPSTERKKIKRQLNRCGINSMTLFDSPDKVAEYIEWGSTNKH